MHLVQQHETPLLILQPVHYFLGLVGTLGGQGDHGIGGDEYFGSYRLVFGLMRESAYGVVVSGRPHLELHFPLLHRDARVAQDERPLIDRTCGCDAHKSLTGTARQHNDTAASSAVTKHFAQALLLVGTQCGVRPQINVNVGYVRVIAEVVFGKQRIVKFLASFNK